MLMGNERCTIWILGTQLFADHPAIRHAEQLASCDDIRIVMVESTALMGRLPYHRKKLVLVLSTMRHYAAALRERGYQVNYVHAKSMLNGLKQHVAAYQPTRLITMAAADYVGRKFQQEKLPQYLDCAVEVIPNEAFLVELHNPFPDAEPGKRYVMEHFYRDMRQHFDVLMNANGTPVGGNWNFDKLNRKPLPKDVQLPEPPSFSPDAITRVVMDEVAQMGQGIGSVEGFDYAVTHEEADAALTHFIDVRLEQFGPYEDAMSSRGVWLFHSILSPYLNLGLLDPLEAVRKVEAAYYEGRAPIHSVEGFIRQIVGWREYMYWQYWQGMPDMAHANYWQAKRPMPAMFWDANTDMNCIRHVVERAKDTGYAHHIERLMVVSNFALLAGINPADVTRWFKAFFIDAYDWVMQPNVVGMGLNADGGRIATKPYVASANYINKMSDYCKGCRFDHRRRTGEDACPFNVLYWNFLIENENTLRANPRAGKNVLGLRHLDAAERARVQEQAQAFLMSLPYEETGG